MLGRDVPVGFLWLSRPRRRLSVPFDAALRSATLTALDEVRAWLRADTLPPAVNDARCRRCQLIDHCQPELSSCARRVRDYMARVVECAC